MVLTKKNNLVLIFLILCSASFYKFSILGPLQKLSEFMGVSIIVLSIVLYITYSDHHSIKRNFVFPIVLILASMIPSMIMAYHEHGQSFSHTLYAQRAMYYYLVYFLLHYMKPDLKDLERIFLGLGVVYVGLYYIQTILYPTILFDAYVRAMRGTIRIYLPGMDYMAISLFIMLQYFFRTNKITYLLGALVFFSIFILMGGRQGMAIVAFAIVLFIIIDRKVKSRGTLLFLGSIAAIAIFFIFRDIFEALIEQSRKDTSTAEGYIRVRAARFFLMEYSENPWTYITGHGRSYGESKYGAELGYYSVNLGFFLADLGIIGNYIYFGLLFVVGLIVLFIRLIRTRIEERFAYIKYILVTILFSLITAAGFGTKADAITFIMILAYMIDVSSLNRSQTIEVKQTEM